MTAYSPRRRALLRLAAQFAALGPAATLAAPLAAAANLGGARAKEYRALVCVFLAGGNDSFNTLLPTDAASWSRYEAARGKGEAPIALPRPGTAPDPAAPRHTPAFLGGPLPIAPGSDDPETAFALHPALAPLLPLFAQKRLALLANVGPLVAPTTKAEVLSGAARLPANLRSHNDQQSVWQSGAGEGARLGWGGLMADALLDANGAHALFTAVSAAGSAVLLSGRAAVPYQVAPKEMPAIRVNAVATPALYGSPEARAALLASIQTAHGESPFGRDYAAVTRRSLAAAETLDGVFAEGAVAGVRAPDAYENPVTGVRGANPLAAQLHTVARFIAAAQRLSLRRQVFFVSLPGWDSHGRQNRTHPDNLAKLAHALAYFDATLADLNGEDRRGQVTTFTMSEFGRTFATNGDGTDHGWGGHQMMLGGAVKGGAVYGRFPSLGLDGADFASPDMAGGLLIPTTAVDQYAATLARWMGLSRTELAAVFPQLGRFASGGLGFL